MPNRRLRIPQQPAGNPVEISLKVAGIHWWYRTRSHAAELTAGYYNTEKRDGYNSVIEICARYGAALTLTCVEMCDAQHPPEALCGPEGLLRQVRFDGAKGFPGHTYIRSWAGQACAK
jgi:beta-amylase